MFDSLWNLWDLFYSLFGIIVAFYMLLKHPLKGMGFCYNFFMFFIHLFAWPVVFVYKIQLIEK